MTFIESVKRQAKEHPVLKWTLAGALYLGITGYVFPGLDTGQWNPRKQLEYSERYTNLYLQLQDLTDRNTNNYIDHTEETDMCRRLLHCDNPTIEEMKRAIESYKQEGR